MVLLYIPFIYKTCLTNILLVNSKDILTLTLTLSLPRYHTGSLAFGSLILALIQMFRIALEYLDRRLKGKIPEFMFSQTS